MIEVPTEELRLKAAGLVAAGKLTGDQIAEKVGVSRRTITEWKGQPEFQDLVKKAKNAWRARAHGEGLADKDFRLLCLNDRHKRLRGVIRARSKDEGMRQAPGGDTGLLTVTYKMQAIGDGMSEPVPEFAVDTGLLSEMRALEQAAATEKGQWKQKIDLKHTGQVSIEEQMQRLNRGRERVATAKAKRDAAKTGRAPVDTQPGRNSGAGNP